MPRRAQPLPPTLDESFKVSAARDLGVSPERLRRSDLTSPWHGVRVRTGSVIPLATAYATRMSPHAFFSHTTAARLWHLPLPCSMRHELPLHVSVPRERRAPEGQGVAGHAVAITPADIVTREGLRVTSLERTVLDLASRVDDEGLLALLDSALWHKRDVFERATHGSLRAALDRMSVRVARPRVNQLAALACDRADSAPESAFRLRFVRAGFPEVEANQPVHGALGEFIAQPDLIIRRYRLAFDYEGDGHRVDKAQWRKDLRRVPLLQDAGWHHTRLSGDDLTHPGSALARTRRLLIERGWRP